MKIVGIVACSNGQKREFVNQNIELLKYLENQKYTVIMSNCIYEKANELSGTGEERANELMKLFRNSNVEEIYDISGGDLANQVLDYLDFDVIKNSKATFWGYSDLTTIINAIYAQTGRASVLYQVKNMVWGEAADIQRNRFVNRDELFNPSFRIIQGESIKGVVVGGNIRCFLKLAGTKYFPDLNNKVLLLESNGGTVPQMVTYLSQLKQLGVFDIVNGILLGTFSQMDSENCQPNMITLVKQFVSDKLPIAKTNEIGHGNDSKAIWIGKAIKF